MNAKNYFFAFLVSASYVLGYNYPCADIHFSPYSGAENVMFLQQGLEKFDQQIFSEPMVFSQYVEKSSSFEKLSDERQWQQKLKSSLFWIPVGASCVVTQHEVFGHGYRIRDLGEQYAKVTGYRMYVVSGVTFFDAMDRLTTSQMLTIDIAGLEADSILSNRLKMKWLQDGKIDGRQFPMYSFASLSFFGYATTVKKNPSSLEECWNDISSFLFFLNKTYQDSHLGYTRVRNLSLLNFLDPFFWSSMLAQAVYTEYDMAMTVPMFRFGPISYMPSMKIVLTPFGLQGYWEHFLVASGVPTYLYMKWGKHGENIYYGFGVENRKIFHGRFGSLGARLDVWHQPRVLFEPGALTVTQFSELPPNAPIPPLYSQSLLTEKITGVACSLISSYESTRLPILLFAELGYKTDGYLPGEALRSSPIARGGISGRF